jgi:hypothetical protein
MSWSSSSDGDYDPLKSKEYNSEEENSETEDFSISVTSKARITTSGGRRATRNSLKTSSTTNSFIEDIKAQNGRDNDNSGMLKR